MRLSRARPPRVRLDGADGVIGKLIAMSKGVTSVYVALRIWSRKLCCASTKTSGKAARSYVQFCGTCSGVKGQIWELILTQYEKHAAQPSNDS